MKLDTNMILNVVIAMLVWFFLNKFVLSKMEVFQYEADYEE